MTKLCTLIYCVENEFNPTSEVQNIENGVFQNAPFANGHFPNGGYSCLRAVPIRTNELFYALLAPLGKYGYCTTRKLPILVNHEVH